MALLPFCQAVLREDGAGVGGVSPAVPSPVHLVPGWGRVGMEASGHHRQGAGLGRLSALLQALWSYAGPHAPMPGGRW